MERRLAAIFAADMVGYSRLMEADEVGTLARQKVHRSELIDSRIEAHGGRIIKLTGDGMIAEFPSVVEAVQCAVSIQREMDAREADISKDKKIRYRVAVNLGDVIFDEGDVYGDGVNIAARLEALAEPGGVVVSGTAYDHLKSNVEVGYEDLGEQQVKNIKTPVRVYRIVPEGAAISPRRKQNFRRKALIVSIGIAALALLIAGATIWQFASTPEASSSGPKTDAILAMPAGPKIVVLPFENLSGDPDQDYFVDGLVEELTTRLTEHGYFFVIARNSAFKYKGQSPDVRDVGKDLGVDYVVEGSVRRSGERIRLNAQLLNASDGTHVWAKTYDRAFDVEGLFGIQDELTTAISRAVGEVRGAISQTLLKQMEAKRPTDIAAYECVLLSWNYWESYSPTIHARARDCLEAAVKRDPSYADGWTNLSHIYRAEYENVVNQRPDPMGRSIHAADRGVDLNPTSFWAHQMRAYAVHRGGRKEDALYSIDRALELSPNHPRALHNSATLLMSLGDWGRGMAIWQKVIKLDPTPPPWTYFTPLFVHHHRGELEEAYRYFLMIKHSPMGGWYRLAAFEAILLAEMERLDEAREAMARALDLNPGFAETAHAELSVWFWANPEYLETLMDGLYKAGLSRQPD